MLILILLNSLLALAFSLLHCLLAVGNPLLHCLLAVDISLLHCLLAEDISLLYCLLAVDISFLNCLLAVAFVGTIWICLQGSYRSRFYGFHHFQDTTWIFLSGIAHMSTQKGKSIYLFRLWTKLWTDPADLQNSYLRWSKVLARDVYLAWHIFFNGSLFFPLILLILSVFFCMHISWIFPKFLPYSPSRQSQLPMLITHLYSQLDPSHHLQNLQKVCHL